MPEPDFVPQPPESGKPGRLMRFWTVKIVLKPFL